MRGMIVILGAQRASLVQSAYRLKEGGKQMELTRQAWLVSLRDYTSLLQHFSSENLPCKISSKLVQGIEEYYNNIVQHSSYRQLRKQVQSLVNYFNNLNQNQVQGLVFIIVYVTTMKYQNIALDHEASS
ncbi:Hypothetical_protein [Hexamita inflata]|uniref:Hypothetical_protein n=1 Tax=Hexamita inflata TaxID=28002 RepID=A0AA86RD75_9EUKA|nr:Hypothetical protein HINF_LOCUS63426 [Hexamita inflata]